jgi:hypothetical protein
MLASTILLSGCADKAIAVIASAEAFCGTNRVRVVCVRAEDQLTPDTAQSIRDTNAAIAQQCKGVASAVACPKGQKPRVVPAPVQAPVSRPVPEDALS